jgi:hypothetical protein
MTQLNQPSARVHRDSPVLHSKTFRITSFADPAPQLPWNDILAKNTGGGGCQPQTLSNQADGSAPRKATPNVKVFVPRFVRLVLGMSFQLSTANCQLLHQNPMLRKKPIRSNLGGANRMPSTRELQETN